MDTLIFPSKINPTGRFWVALMVRSFFEKLAVGGKYGGMTVFHRGMPWLNGDEVDEGNVILDFLY